MTFGFATTADEVLAGIDLTGKRAIVTGASGGLGEETARALAAKGAAVTIAARNLAKAEAAAEQIRQSTGNAQVDIGELELDKPASVRAFASSWLARHDALNLLINNAGIMACPLMRTAEGWEMQFATNHLGHFLLTNLLVPALKAGAPARVINLSSSGHRRSTVDLEDPHFERREYDPFVGYGQSKTANIWFSMELNERLASQGVTAFAVHPGGIMTELGRHLTQETIAQMTKMLSESKIQLKSIPAGSATSVWAATSADLEGKGGLFLEDCHIAEPATGEGNSGYAPHAYDKAGAARLWTLSEELLGETFSP
jgi:NAD(P)-dependent dehydrogenase (short-subunit alcohol dehydrogenase family)